MFIINHIVGRNLACLKSPGITKILLPGRILLGFISYLSEFGKGRVLSLECAGSEHPKPTELTLDCVAIKSHLSQTIENSYGVASSKCVPQRHALGY